ncbi:MAG: tryptophan synthase alpha chain [Bradymonadia bacterium]|jgi:tryptophan synthase alpha chain
MTDSTSPGRLRPDPLRDYLAARKGAIFMPFTVIGDPDTARSHRIVDALVAGGADVLEFGFPFSDPPADGPVIQAADTRALKAGMTPPKAFEFLAAVHDRHGLPMVLLMYWNLILQYGVDAFYARCKAVGVQGVLIADLPLELAAPAVDAANKHGVAPVFLATALTPTDRLAKLAKAGGGFIYTVAQVGVTGERAQLASSLPDTLARLRSVTDLPLLAGFGISDGAQARAALDAGADGVIVGSALVRLIDGPHLVDGPPSLEETLAKIQELAQDIATAVHEDT